MNREILFRAKGQTSDKWYEGLLTRLDEYVCHIKGRRYNEWICDSSTVCQYTGLTDKNGRRSFEGDIVKIPLFKPDIMGIGFIDGAFCLVNEKKEYVADIHHIHHAGINKTEIIGNIFDNPDLIGG